MPPGRWAFVFGDSAISFEPARHDDYTMTIGSPSIGSPPIGSPDRDVASCGASSFVRGPAGRLARHSPENARQTGCSLSLRTTYKSRIKCHDFQVRAFPPTDAAPKTAAGVIVDVQVDAASADTASNKSLDTPGNHRLGDSRASKSAIHSDMIKVTAPTIVATLDRSHNRILDARNRTHTRIAIQESQKVLVGTPDSNMFGGLPQLHDGIEIINRHGTDLKRWVAHGHTSGSKAFGEGRADSLGRFLATGGNAGPQEHARDKRACSGNDAGIFVARLGVRIDGRLVGGQLGL